RGALRRIWRKRHGPRPRTPRSPAVRLRRLLSHPVPGIHDRTRGLDRGARGGLAARQRAPWRAVPVLDQDLRRLVRHGRGLWHRHVVPVRHQLEPVLRRGRQRDRAAFELRGSDGILPRGDLPRRPAVRAGPGSALAALRLGVRGGDRHADLGVLDPLRQQLDADARGPRAARRHLLCGQLVGGDLQPVVPLSLRPHGCGLLPDHRVRRRRGQRLAPAEAEDRGARAHRAVDGARAGRGTGAGAAGDRRPARPEHPGAPAGQGRRHGRPLGEHGGRADDPVRPARPGGRDQPIRDRHPQARQPDPDPRPGRRRAGPEGVGARGPALCADRVLVVPVDGRDRPDHDRDRLGQPHPAPRRAAVRGPLVAWHLRRLRADRLHRAARRLDHHRGRAPALGGVRPDAHGRRRLAGGDRRRGQFLAHGLHRRVRADLPGRGLLHDPTGPARPGAARGRPARAASAAGRAAPPVRGRADLRARGVGAMAESGIDLPLIWAAIIVVGVIMYVLLDGFDLGIGILFPFLPTDEDRDLAMNSVAPVWDGNETWLVLGGAGLLAAFPLAYAVILPGTYLPLIVMLLGLIFRGVAFEFRFKAATSRHFWDKSFHYGSLAATIAQGIVLCAFIQGFEVENRQFAGGMFVWLTPFTLLTGAALGSGDALPGATWLLTTNQRDILELCYG